MTTLRDKDEWIKQTDDGSLNEKIEDRKNEMLCTIEEKSVHKAYMFHSVTEL